MRTYRKFLCVFLSLIILCGTLSAGIYANSDSENTGQNSAESTGRIEPPTRTVYHYYIAAYQNGDLLTCTGFGNAPYMSRYADGNSNSHFYQKWEFAPSGTTGYFYIYPLGGDRPYALSVDPVTREVITASVDLNDTKQLWKFDNNSDGTFCLKVMATGTAAENRSLNIGGTAIKVGLSGTKFFSINYDTYTPPTQMNYQSTIYLAPGSTRSIVPTDQNGVQYNPLTVGITHRFIEQQLQYIKVDGNNITGIMCSEVRLTVYDKVTDINTRVTAYVTGIADGVYMMRNIGSGYYAAPSGTTISSQVYQTALSESSDLKWQFTLNQTTGYYSIRTVGLPINYYLTVSENSSSDNADIILGADPNASGAKWRVIYSGNHEYYDYVNGKYILYPSTNSNLCLSVGAVINHTLKQSNENGEFGQWNLLVENPEYTNLFIGTTDDHSSMDFYLARAMDGFINHQYFGNDLVSLPKNDILHIMKSTRYFGVLTHGEQSRISLSGGIYFTTELNINDINSLPSNYFDDLKVVCLGACYCGQGGANANNLVNAFFNKGVDFVVGFTIAQNNVELNPWMVGFSRSLAENNEFSFVLRDADLWLFNVRPRSEDYSYSTSYRLVRGDETASFFDN